MLAATEPVLTVSLMRVYTSPQTCSGLDMFFITHAAVLLNSACVHPFREWRSNYISHLSQTVLLKFILSAR